jgi:hypothetical protein
MAKAVANLVISTDTWLNSINKTNDLSFLVSTEVVTANSTTNGAVTSGNCFISGIFAATSIATPTLRAGNVQSNAGTIAVLSPIQVVNSHISSNNVTTTNTNLQTVDSFDITVFRTAKYVIQIFCPTFGYQATEILALHDGAATFQTEYATIFSNTFLGNFTTAISGNNFNLQFTPVNANNTVLLTRTVMTV